jgi:hypothetical protein
MNIAEFFKTYGNEEACKELFKSYREKQGLTCRDCGHDQLHWLKTVDRWQCKKCMHQQTLRSGTILEASKLPYHYWIYTIYLMTNTKKGISAKELQRQLGHKRYEPIWAMMHKIRAAMGKRDSKYQMENVVELDDGYVKADQPDQSSEKDETPKRGRGTQSHSSILMMASVGPGKSSSSKKSRKPTALRYVRMRHIEDITGDTFESEASENIDSSATVISDNFRGFTKIKNVVKEHASMNVPKEEASTILPWVHTTISNLKRTLLGVNHSVHSAYLQNYLNEFCYKVNRRYFGSKLFDRLMITAVEAPWYSSNIT